VLRGVRCSNATTDAKQSFITFDIVLGKPVRRLKCYESLGRVAAVLLRRLWNEPHGTRDSGRSVRRQPYDARVSVFTDIRIRVWIDRRFYRIRRNETKRWRAIRNDIARWKILAVKSTASWERATSSRRKVSEHQSSDFIVVRTVTYRCRSVFEYTRNRASFARRTRAESSTTPVRRRDKRGRNMTTRRHYLFFKHESDQKSRNRGDAE